MTDIAKLDQYGLLLAAGEDARAFLHAQLTNDIENLVPGQARYAGWCSAKGRLLASFLVVPFAGGFLLQLSRDLVPTVAKRLSMFILRSRVKLTDAGGQWAQFGIWGAGTEAPLSVTESDGSITVRIDEDRSLVFAPEGRYTPNASTGNWALAEVRAGRPLIAQSTQDQFVPQMVNLELSGGVDFKKGCYPGQEIVARAQYRGEVKRRMYRLGGGQLQPGQDLYSDDAPGQAGGTVGTVVNAAGDEALAVLQTSAVEGKSPIRAQPQGTALEILPLPYSQ
jgi:hypothetical protein